MSSTPNLDYLDQIDIALLAPSRAGKSTLIAAMYTEFNRRLRYASRLGSCGTAVLAPLDVNNNVYAFPSQVLGKPVRSPVSTKTHINELVRVHKKSLLNSTGRRFRADAPGSRVCSLMSFNLANDNTSMPFRILDYPGGAVSSGSIVSTDVDDNAKVLNAYSSDCFALIVPVFALALVEQYELEEKLERGEISQEEFEARTELLDRVLCIDDIKVRVAEWLIGRAAQGKQGLLIIAPVKCETYLNGVNIRETSQRMGLLEQVAKQSVFEQIVEEIREMADEETFETISSLVDVEYLPVQTFGNVFDKALIEWPLDIVERRDDPNLTFSDIYFKKRNATTLKPVGAAGILQTVLKHRNDILAEAARARGMSLQESLDNQGFFERIWGTISGGNTRTGNKIRVAFETASEMNKFVAQIARMGLGTKNLKVWSWDIDDYEEELDDDDDDWEADEVIEVAAEDDDDTY